MNVTKDEIVKNEIIIQAQKLFQQFGLKKTTMDEIALACGKAKSTLYHYYKSKEEVFDVVMQLELTNLRKIVKQYVDEAKTVKDKMMAYFFRFHKEVIDKINIYRLLKHELISERIVESHLPKLMEFEQAYITRILEDGYDSGELKGFVRTDIPWFSEILVAAFFGIVRYSIESDNGIDIKKLEKTTEILIPRIFI